MSPDTMTANRRRALIADGLASGRGATVTEQSIAALRERAFGQDEHPGTAAALAEE
jgi:hypothetical protein